MYTFYYAGKYHTTLAPPAVLTIKKNTHKKKKQKTVWCIPEFYSRYRNYRDAGAGSLIFRVSNKIEPSMQVNALFLSADIAGSGSRTQGQIQTDNGVP